MSTNWENSNSAASAKGKLHICLSPGPPEGQAVLLTGQAHGGGVHDGHELLDVRGQHAIEQLFVPVLQRHQQDVPEGETESALHVEAPQWQMWKDETVQLCSGGSQQQLYCHVWVCALTCPGDCCGSRNFSSHAALAHPARGSRAAAGRGCPAADAPPAWRPSPAGARATVTHQRDLGTARSRMTTKSKIGARRQHRTRTAMRRAYTQRSFLSLTFCILIAKEKQGEGNEAEMWPCLEQSLPCLMLLFVALSGD